MAVPPLAEQHRIADQVDRLMQLCDALVRKDHQAAALVDAVVAGLA